MNLIFSREVNIRFFAFTQQVKSIYPLLSTDVDLVANGTIRRDIGLAANLTIRSLFQESTNSIKWSPKFRATVAASLEFNKTASRRTWIWGSISKTVCVLPKCKCAKFGDFFQLSDATDISFSRFSAMPCAEDNEQSAYVYCSRPIFGDIWQRHCHCVHHACLITFLYTPFNLRSETHTQHGSRFNYVGGCCLISPQVAGRLIPASCVINAARDCHHALLLPSTNIHFPTRHYAGAVCAMSAPLAVTHWHACGEMTSQNLWSQYVRHFVGITWHNMWS